MRSSQGKAQKAFRYDSRIVAFIDVLGMKELLSQTEGKSVARSIALILDEIISPVKLEVELPHVRWNSNVSVAFKGWRNDLKSLQITSISDSIVISIPENQKIHNRQSRIFSILICLETVFWIQRSLLQLGISTRGAISVGKLHHTPSVIVGVGLVAAYQLEKHSAVYPRVVLDDAVCDILTHDEIPSPLIRQRLGNIITRDSDGLYFVDYLGIDITEIEPNVEEISESIKKFIIEELGRYSTDIRVRQKLNWLLEYVDRANMVRRAERIRPHRTRGPLETRYPRHR